MTNKIKLNPFTLELLEVAASGLPSSGLHSLLFLKALLCLGPSHPAWDQAVGEGWGEGCGGPTWTRALSSGRLGPLLLLLHPILLQPYWEAQGRGLGLLLKLG